MLELHILAFFQVQLILSKASPKEKMHIIPAPPGMILVEYTMHRDEMHWRDLFCLVQSWSSLETFVDFPDHQ